jgi:uridine kinase
MVFAYQGFTHESGRRCFLFHSIEANVPIIAYSIQVDLRLFVQYKIPVQDGPSFCLQMLTKASSEGSSNLDRLRSYQVVGEDFHPMVEEREKKEADKILKWREQKRIRTAALIQSAMPKSLVEVKNAV